MIATHTPRPSGHPSLHSTERSHPPVKRRGPLDDTVLFLPEMTDDYPSTHSDQNETAQSTEQAKPVSKKSLLKRPKKVNPLYHALAGTRKALSWLSCGTIAWPLLGLGIERLGVYPGAFRFWDRWHQPAPEHEVIEVQDGEVTTQGYLFRNPTTGTLPAPVVVFFHGNNDTVRECAFRVVPKFHAMGVHVLMPEYRGFDKAGGRPRKARIIQDMHQMIDEVVTREYIDARQVIYHGYSLGGGMACAMHEARPCRAMILSSTFTSTMDMAEIFLYPGHFLKERYDNLAVVKEMNIPLLVIHGNLDPLIPVDMGRMLANAAPRAVYHEHYRFHGWWGWTPKVWRAIEEFTDNHC